MARQLAAVLAADVVEYTRLMGENADATLTALRRLRAEVFHPLVAGLRGVVVKSLGDGWIVRFDAAADAVTCAMQLQDKMVADEKIRLRVGVHLGDIALEEEDVFGDGVNVAARLEALCKPGGVTISDAVYSTLDGTLRPAFDDAGQHKLKHVDRPVQVWSRGGLTGAGHGTAGLEGFPRLAITPVATSDTRSSVLDLANALTYDLETNLRQSPWLRVHVDQGADRASLRLAPVLRASGDKLRLEARLTTPDGAAIFSEKYNGDLADVFDWQDETALKVSSECMTRTVEWSVARSKDKPDATLNWEDWMMRSFAERNTELEGITRSFQWIQKAVDLKPNSTLPYEIMLSFLGVASVLGYASIVQAYQKQFPFWLAEIDRIGQRGPETRAFVAVTEYVLGGNVPRAQAAAHDLLRDAPFNFLARGWAGHLFQVLGEPENSLACYGGDRLMAAHADFQAVVSMGMGAANVQLGRFEEGLAHTENALRLRSGHLSAHRWRIAALANLGRLDEAKAALAEHDRLQPNQTISGVQAVNRYVDNAYTQRYFEGLKLAGMPE